MTIFEKNDKIGGKLNELERDGFRFDLVERGADSATEIFRGNSLGDRYQGTDLVRTMSQDVARFVRELCRRLWERPCPPDHILSTFALASEPSG